MTNRPASGGSCPGYGPHMRACPDRDRLAVWAEDDGGAVRMSAPAQESAIEAGSVPPVLLVGPRSTLPDLRSQEYLPRRNRRRFDAHLRFVVGEVIPWADERFGPVPRPWGRGRFFQRRGLGHRRRAAAPGPARGGGRVQRRRRPAADQRRGPFGRSPALRRGRHARARLPAVDLGVGEAAGKGRAPVPSRGMDRRPRPGVVAAAAPGRAGLAAPALRRCAPLDAMLACSSPGYAARCRRALYVRTRQAAGAMKVPAGRGTRPVR